MRNVSLETENHLYQDQAVPGLHSTATLSDLLLQKKKQVSEKTSSYTAG